jgi:hypothetical protein
MEIGIKLNGRVSYLLIVSKDGILKISLNRYNFKFYNNWFKRKYNLTFKSVEDMYLYLRDVLKLEYSLNSYNDILPLLEKFIKKHIFEYITNEHLQKINVSEDESFLKNIILKNVTIKHINNQTNQIYLSLYYRDKENGTCKYIRRVAINTLKVLIENYNNLRTKKIDNFSNVSKSKGIFGRIRKYFDFSIF